MPADLVDVWRDEDGTPPPAVERTVEWWRDTYQAGAAGEACDQVIAEHNRQAAAR